MENIVEKHSNDWVAFDDRLMFGDTPVTLHKKARVVGTVEGREDLLCVRPISGVIVDCPHSVILGDPVVRQASECESISAPKARVIEWAGGSDSGMRTFVLDIEECGWAASSDIANLIVITEELETAIADAENCQAVKLTTVAQNKIRQSGGDVCGVLIRTENGVAAVSDMGRVTWLPQSVLGPESEDSSQ